MAVLVLGDGALREAPSTILVACWRPRPRIIHLLLFCLSSTGTSGTLNPKSSGGASSSGLCTAPILLFLLLLLIVLLLFLIFLVMGPRPKP